MDEEETDNEDPLRIWVGVDEDEDVDKDEDVDEDEDEDCEDDELTRQVVDVGICWAGFHSLSLRSLTPKASFGKNPKIFLKEIVKSGTSHQPSEVLISLLLGRDTSQKKKWFVQVHSGYIRFIDVKNPVHSG